MKEFPITAVIEKHGIEQLGLARQAFEQVAAGQVDDEFMGICWNSQQVFNDNVCDRYAHGDYLMYAVTTHLFQLIVGWEDSFPLIDKPTSENWWRRKRWCAAFVLAITDGVLRVDDEMLAEVREQPEWAKCD